MVNGLPPVQAQPPASAKVAPLDDEELLGAVQRAFREIIIPELERGGADEFVVSQVRSCLSILSYVGRGLQDRQVARMQADVALASLLDSQPAEASAGAPLDGAVRDLLLHRLDTEIRSRTGT